MRRVVFRNIRDMKNIALIFLATLVLCGTGPAAIKRDPREVLIESQRAFEKRDFKRAVELLTQAVDANPELAPAKPSPILFRPCFPERKC